MESQEEHFEKGSWVFMHPAAIGPHRVRRRDVLENHWKGRILGFKDKKSVGIVAVVQHVYSISDIYLPSQNRRAFPVNCRYFVPFLLTHCNLLKVFLDGMYFFSLI